MEDHKFLRQPEPEAPEPGEGATVDLGELSLVKLQKDAIVIDTGADGSVTVNFGPFGIAPSSEASDHDTNLADGHVDSGTLGKIADELIRLVGDDISRQEERLSNMVKTINLLGLKLEEPKSEPNSEGISTVVHPALLEAVLRFQANARGEMLPADGPVKVANEGDSTLLLDDASNELEEAFNHYLTVTAKEYVPDTDRMFFALGLHGEAYRKVYFHPLKRRPIIETIDRKDIVLSDGAVSLEACARITHRSKMRPSIVKQMQLSGAWREAPLSYGVVSPDLNRVDQTLDQLAGIQANTQIGGLEEVDREIWEIYCELDLPGFEHEEDGETTGLPLPYRVTLDKDSRQVLEIRRWWKEGDPSYVRQEVFCEWVFVPAFNGVNIGLGSILGNGARALTAMVRIAIDSGMLANFPGSVMARSSGKQQTSNIRVGPGQVAPLDVDGVPLNQAFMPLPYHDVTGGMLNLIQQVEQLMGRLGGTAEVAVGEGRQDAPVGTTIALLEASTKIISAVHKRMHTAQSKEFQLLRELFIRDPEPLWRSDRNPNFQADREKLRIALENKDIVPKADPNTASQTLRIQKAQAIYMLASQNPTAFDQKSVYQRLLTMIGVEDADDLFNKNPPAPPPMDESKIMQAKAAMVKAQASMLDSSIKAQSSQGDMALRTAQLQTEMIKQENDKTALKIDSANHAADRIGKIKLEQMRLAQSSLVHKDKLAHDQRTQAQDIFHQAASKGLDLDHARRQQAMELAHDQQQQAVQHLHEQALANRQEEAAREMQFMKPDKESE